MYIGPGTTPQSFVCFTLSAFRCDINTPMVPRVSWRASSRDRGRDRQAKLGEVWEPGRPTDHQGPVERHQTTARPHESPLGRRKKRQMLRDVPSFLEMGKPDVTKQAWPPGPDSRPPHAQKAMHEVGIGLPRFLLEKEPWATLVTNREPLVEP